MEKENFKKPYEISIWADELKGEGDNSYYEEKLLAIIGSDTMTSYNKCINPTLHQNINGETTLEFSMVYKYFDEEVD